jgi:hypothetical protein
MAPQRRLASLSPSSNLKVTQFPDLQSKMAPQCRSASSPSDRSFCSLAASSEARCRSKSAAGMAARVPAKPPRKASMRASSSDGACVPGR